MKVDIRVIAMRRSGSHALLNWLAGHYDDVWYFNDCRPADVPQRDRRHTDSLPCLPRIALAPNHSPAVLLRGFEDRKIGSDLRTIAPSVDERPVLNCLLLRDPFNLAASRLQAATLHRYARSFRDLAKFVLRWKEYAREFMGETNYIGDKIAISYNQWVTSYDYRRDLAKQIDRPLNDATRNQVSKQGGGSSFDGRKVDGSDLKVLDRWQYFEQNEEYRQYLSDPELVAMARDLFPEAAAAYLSACPESFHQTHRGSPIVVPST